MSSLDEEDDRKGGFSDIGNIPCFRKSMFTGISGGIATGLGYFLFTSMTKKSANIGFGTYVVLTVGMWSFCRYGHAQDEKKQKEIEKAIHNKVLTEGGRPSR